MPNIDHLNAVRRYLKTIEDGTFADIADLFTPDMVMEQLPNRVYPNGLRGTLSQMAQGFERGRKLLSSQTNEIKNALMNMFFEFRNGKIASQRNYNCFEPW
jgi:ketosteroid isomerase-like protein